MIHAKFSSFLHFVMASLALPLSLACSQNLGFNQFGVGRFGVVGGVSVDADGVVRDLTVEERTESLRQLRAAASAPTGKLAERAPLRMVSLTGLQTAIAQSIADQRPLTDEMLYLAGLQRVEYVFIYPERGDIVLAGPAEPWEVRDDASVVGKFSGRPVVRLEDLLVALRISEAARQEVISVSIDPTPEGTQRLRQLLSRIGTGVGFNPAVAEPAMKEALGPQVISLTTVPDSSRMARTLVAADYQMKRLAMKLDSAPVRGLPSYLDMVRDSGARRGVQPRWWMTCDYDSIAHSDDRLAWKITGSGIRALSEDEYVSESGQRVGTGNTNKFAQRWADLFTAKFSDLSASEPAFGELRNVMDLNVVAAVVRSQQLQQLAGCDLSLLLGEATSRLETPQWQSPKLLEPQCSFVRGQAGWTVSASGGVEINPWMVLSQRAQRDDSILVQWQQADQPSDQWWWD